MGPFQATASSLRSKVFRPLHQMSQMCFRWGGGGGGKKKPTNRLDKTRLPKPNPLRAGVCQPALSMAVSLLLFLRVSGQDPNQTCGCPINKAVSNHQPVRGKPINVHPGRITHGGVPLQPGTPPVDKQELINQGSTRTAVSINITKCGHYPKLFDHDQMCLIRFRKSAARSSSSNCTFFSVVYFESRGTLPKKSW